jgi:hypothetical protein
MDSNHVLHSLKWRTFRLFSYKHILLEYIALCELLKDLLQKRENNSKSVRFEDHIHTLILLVLILSVSINTCRYKSEATKYSVTPGYPNSFMELSAS